MLEPFVFSPPVTTSVPVLGGGLFPVRRVFCIVPLPDLSFRVK
ncbi:MAG: hypothetical protein AAGA95_06455 [Pseudomonadota bacterium]